jgi:hypothetical protein
MTPWRTDPASTVSRPRTNFGALTLDAPMLEALMLNALMLNALMLDALMLDALGRRGFSGSSRRSRPGPA